MAFELAEAVPWGRSYDEYVAMFALTPHDLTRRILGCGDGPAAFNARLTRRGGTIVSADPLYRFPAARVRERIAEVTPIVLEQVRRNADAFLWTHIGSVEDLARIRAAAMQEFLADYAEAAPGTRYQDVSLPALPFHEQEFDLALCSHFLFLYGEQHPLAFHVESLIELCRVALEVRVFPLVELSGQPSRHLTATIEALSERGYAAVVSTVDYQFQAGGNQMLTVLRTRETPE